MTAGTSPPPGTPRLPNCVWTPSDTTGLTCTPSVDTTSGGTETLYQHHATVTGFDPTDVHSYPAIHRDTRSHCTVEVGVADDTLLTVAVDATVCSSAPGPGRTVLGDERLHRRLEVVGAVDA